MKYLRTLLVFLTIIFVIWLVMFLEKGGERERKEFIAREYIGVIKDIRHIEYHRGNPDILISNEWVFLTLDEQLIFDEIKVGDSIVKKGGSEKIVIYRRDSLDNVRVMEF